MISANTTSTRLSAVALRGADGQAKFVGVGDGEREGVSVEENVD